MFSSSFGSPSMVGSSKPFGVNTGGSVFGSTSTGVFGISTTASSSPTFGVQTPATQTQFPSIFDGGTTQPKSGLTSTPVFGKTQPASGSGYTGSILGKTQPASGFGSTGLMFGTTQPASGSGTTGSMFGVTKPASGFGSTGSMFGQTQPASGFGTTGSTVGQTQPVSGFGSTFGQTQPASGFGTTSSTFWQTQPASGFGTTSSTFWQTQPASGLGTTGSTFGQTQPTSRFGSTGSTSGMTQFTFVNQVSSPSNSFTSGLEDKRSGVDHYKTIPSVTKERLVSISGMPANQNKSHEELRWEDYGLRDKARCHNSTAITPPISHSNPFALLNSSSPNPFPTKPLEVHSSQNLSATPFGVPSSPNPFAVNPSTKPLEVPSSPNPFETNPWTKPVEVPSSSNLLATKPFGTPSSPNPFTTKPFGIPSSPNPFVINPSSPKPSEVPSSPIPIAIQPTKSFEVSTSPNLFKTDSTLLPTIIQSTPAQTYAPFTNPNEGQPPAMVGSIVDQNPIVMHHPIPDSNSSGILPAVPQLSNVRSRFSTPIQYGISSIPISDKPITARSSPLTNRIRYSSLLSSRRLSQMRTRVPAKVNVHQPRIPFYCDEGLPVTPSADIGIIPREDPRAYIISQTKKLHIKENMEKTSPLISTS